MVLRVGQRAQRVSVQRCRVRMVRRPMDSRKVRRVDRRLPALPRRIGIGAFRMKVGRRSPAQVNLQRVNRRSIRSNKVRVPATSRAAWVA
jgi:hypothetical protein